MGGQGTWCGGADVAPVVTGGDAVALLRGFVSDMVRTGAPGLERFEIGRWVVDAPGVVRFEATRETWGWRIASGPHVVGSVCVVTREAACASGELAPVPTWREAGRTSPGPVRIAHRPGSSPVTHLRCLEPTTRLGLLREELFAAHQRLTGDAAGGRAG